MWLIVVLMFEFSSLMISISSIELISSVCDVVGIGVNVLIGSISVVSVSFW